MTKQRAKAGVPATSGAVEAAHGVSEDSLMKLGKAQDTIWARLMEVEEDNIGMTMVLEALKESSAKDLAVEQAAHAKDVATLEAKVAELAAKIGRIAADLR